MKTIFILLLLPAFCSAQSKKDSKIVVNVSDTTNLFNRLVLVFYEKGYTLDNKDQTLGYISTQEKTLSVGAVTVVKYRALIKDSIITFSGDLKVNMSFMGVEPTFEPVRFVGKKGSIYMKAWDEMESIAKQFGSLSFVK